MNMSLTRCYARARLLLSLVVDVTPTYFVLGDFEVDSRIDAEVDDEVGVAVDEERGADRQPTAS